MDFSILSSRSLSTDDDLNNTTETDQMINTLYINILISCILSLIFEFSRSIKSLYLNRLLVKNYVDTNRVPKQPSICPYSWIFILARISDQEVCRMVGLDAYMLLRFIALCIRMGFLSTLGGLIFLVPIYSTSPGTFIGWNKYTLANIPNGPSASELWSPVIFCYAFSGFFCQLLYNEYQHFIKKRVEYLVAGDMDTPIQTYYTSMVEKLPKDIKSAPALLEYCEKLFPGNVYSVDIAVDLQELESLISRRHEIRNDLEKAIARWHATGRRPTLNIKDTLYEDFPPPVPTPVSRLEGFSLFRHNCCWSSNVITVDAIDHYAKVLDIMNDSVVKLQEFFFKQRQQEDDSYGLRVQRMHKILGQKTSNILSTVGSKLNDGTRLISTFVHSTSTQEIAEISSRNNLGEDETRSESIPGAGSDQEAAVNNFIMASDAENNTVVSNGAVISSSEAIKGSIIQIGSTITDATKTGALLVGEVTKQGVEGLAKESLKTAKFATKGAMKALYNATRALELLTLGEQLKIASTAFVTFKSRLAACSSQQILLSNKFHKMRFQPAPNPHDIIWKNVCISQSQIELRKGIADIAFQIGALFWSIVVAFIATISNLDSISQIIPSIKQYSTTEFYILLNYYLAVGLLVIILSILPYIFDFVSRYYEGIKLESEIQNSIMTRYFYYLLANVYVAVGLGSVATSLNSIINNPASILKILGSSLPSFSIYFTNLVIIKTLTGIPLEMLRVFPLLDIAIVSMCINKKTVTRREMRTGAFADPAMLYGWIYPNLLMILMIMLTYSCIAPLVVPFCLLFFIMSYFMYKYQLLYIYINESQSGGFMWYAVFNRSMVALLSGVLVLLCYLLIRETFFTGPFYLLFPLPFLIAAFWYQCNKRFKDPAMLLSLEEAVQIDKNVEQQVQNSGDAHPQDSFTDTLFRQPSLVEGPLKPEAYRNHTFGSPSPPRSSYGGGGGGGGGGDSSSGGLAGDNYYSKFATSLNRTPVGVQGMGEDEEKDQEGGPNVDKKNEQDTAELEQQIDKLLDSGGDFTSPRDSLSALGDELTLGMSALQQQFRNSNVSLFSRPSNKKGSMEERLID